MLQHILNQHSKIQSFSDVNSLLALPAVLSGIRPKVHWCVKPIDTFFLFRPYLFYRRFDKFIWLARDPRDAYLSAQEAGYKYFVWSSLRKRNGIDVGFLQRWKRIYRQYFRRPRRWHLIRYEDLVRRPAQVMHGLFSYLGVPFERVYPFEDFNWWAAGGDDKLLQTTTIHSKSMGRYKQQMSRPQLRIFKRLLGREMTALGYE